MMRLVVDTNVVFSALIAGGKTRELMLMRDVEVYLPEFFLIELGKYNETLLEKTGLDEASLNNLLDLVFEDAHIVPKEEFSDEIPEARRAISDTDPDDAPFLALALHLDIPIWSDDRDLQEQKAVDVKTTTEIVEHLLS